jgi:hypothetical protein
VEDNTESMVVDIEGDTKSNDTKSNDTKSNVTSLALNVESRVKFSIK